MTYQITIEASNIKELFKELGSMQADIIGFKELSSTVEPVVAGDFATVTVPVSKVETAQTSTVEAVATATDTKATEKEESKSSDDDELFG